MPLLNGLNYGGYVDPAISPGRIPENLRTYLGYVRSDFKSWWLVLIVIIAVCFVYAAANKRRYPARLACLCLSWAFLVFALVYGNALSENQRYLEFRIQAAIQDMCETEEFLAAQQSGQKMRVQYIGAIDKSPLLYFPNDDQKLLLRLVPNIVNNSWAHGRVYFQWYYGMGYRITVVTSEDFRDLDLPVLKDSFYHTIWGDSEHILIEFKD